MGVASLILGLLALLITLFINIPAGLVLAVVGIVLGAVGMKQKAKLAVGGLVLSVISAALSLLFWIACAACLASLGLF